MADKIVNLNSMFCPLSTEAAARLLNAGNPLASHLYIWLINGRSYEDFLKLPVIGGIKAREAMSQLKELGLVEGKANSFIGEIEDLPDYSAEEIAQGSKGDPAFITVLDEAQNILGRMLSRADLKILYGIYNYLGLPAEVIIELLHYCLTEYRRRYGENKVPSLRYIEKEAYIWARNELLTLELAANYITAMAQKREKHEIVKRSFGIYGRELSAGEKRYLDGWFDDGFSLDMIMLAYDRTVTNTGKLQWSYLNGILRNWKNEGLRSVDEVNAQDSKKKVSAKRAGSAKQENSMDQMRELQRTFEKVQGKGTKGENK